MLKKYLPFLEWGAEYNRQTLISDLIAALVVTVMLIPQSLAYALLAGLPAEIGLYASILPLIAYMFLGSSRTLAVGPVAVASLMTAAAIGKLGVDSLESYILAAVVLALISGMILILMGVLRLGFFTNFLSHPVISGFVTASGLIIALSQLKHILGIEAHGDNVIELFSSLFAHLQDINIITLFIGVASMVFLFWGRKGFKLYLMNKFNLSDYSAGLWSKTGPLIVVFISIILVAVFRLDSWAAVKIVGDVPKGMPQFSFPAFEAEMWKLLFIPALMIAIVGYVETISVAQSLGAKRRQRVDPDQELIALGASNIASSISGGFPVTGGFSRSVVNFEAGAQTPFAGALTAIGILAVALFLTPVIYFLPKAVLGATIIVAVLSLVDIHSIQRSWNYSKRDFIAMALTIIATLLKGVEIGIITGVSASIILHLLRTANPHYAIIGQIPGQEHFRNVERHKVNTSKTVLAIRIDESLHFTNAKFFEDVVMREIAERPEVKHFVLLASAVNVVDLSALESLELINQRLKDAGVIFHLSEVKGPVMDALQKVGFDILLSGRIFLSHIEAMRELDPTCLS